MTEEKSPQQRELELLAARKRAGADRHWWLKEYLALSPSLILVAFWCLVLAVMAGLVLLAVVKAVA